METDKELKQPNTQSELLPPHKSVEPDRVQSTYPPQVARHRPACDPEIQIVDAQPKPEESTVDTFLNDAPSCPSTPMTIPGQDVDEGIAPNQSASEENDQDGSEHDGSYGPHVLAVFPVDSDVYTEFVGQMACARHERFLRIGDISDIEEAISLYRQALSLQPVGHNDRPSSLNNLALALHARYKRSGEVNEVNEAITLHREALSFFTADNNDRPKSLSNLAGAVLDRFQHSGDVSDIKEAINLRREVLSLRPVGHEDRPRSLGKLADAMRDRYERFGDVYDIDEAITLHREALSLQPVGHSDRLNSLNNLAIAIQSKNQRFGAVSDINEAITLHREALSLSPVGHDDRFNSLSNLANAIRIRYERSGDVSDIEEVIALLREALSLLPVGHGDRWGPLTNLSIAIRAGYQRFNLEADDLEEAKLLLHEALDLRPPGHIGHAELVAQLSNLLILGIVRGNFDPSSSLRAIDEAQSLVNEALTDSSTPSAFQLDLALYHGSVSAYATDFRVSLHLQCIKLLQKLVVVSPSIASQQLYLGQYGDIASTLTAHSLDAGSPETAAIVSDGGRSLLLGIIQQYRIPVEELQQMNRELADQLQSVGSQLERLTLLGESKALLHGSAALIPEFTTPQEFMVGVQQDLREQWNILLDQIHLLPGFEYFLTTLPIHMLQGAASEGPIILLNACESRCDAIIMFSSGSPEVVPLRDPVSLHSLVELHQDLDASRRAGPIVSELEVVRIVTCRAEPDNSTMNTLRALDPSSSLRAPTPIAGRDVDDRAPQNQAASGEDGQTRGDGAEDHDTDFEELISGDGYRLLLNLLPEDGDLRPEFLSQVGLTRYDRFEEIGNINDIEEAIKLHQEALSLRPVGNDDRANSLNNLAIAICARYERVGDVNEINDAIALHREAFSLRPVGHCDRSQSLNNLALAIQGRYKRFGGMHNVHEAIGLLREALSLQPVGHNGRSIPLSNLANAIQVRYEQSGDPNDLGEAITLHRQALSLRPVGHKDRSDSLTNLANATQARYMRSGNINDLTEAIILHREALLLRPVGHNRHSRSLNNLANGVQIRYQRYGDVNDLEEAIALHREALSLRPVGHDDRPNSLNNLGNMIGVRYELLRDVNDINEAISLHRESLALRLVGHNDRPKFLNNLAAMLRTRYERFGYVDDINEAVALHRESLSLRPVGHNDRSKSLESFANALKARYERLGDVNDINEAITIHREALSLRPEGHNDRSSSLYSLADAIRVRCEHLNEVSGLKEAKLLLREALGLQPPGHAGRYSTAAMLGLLLIPDIAQRELDLESSTRSLDEAQFLIYDAVTDSSAPLTRRLVLALHHGNIPAHKADFRISMHLQCIELLQRLVVISPNLSSQEDYLREQGWVASTVTAYALDAGSPETALVVSNGGRSLLLGAIQRYRSPLADLQEVNQELADNLQSVGSQLERLALLGESQSPTPKFATELDFMLAIQRDLREQWNRLLDQIHAMRGFEHFLTNPPFSELQAAASDGPIILLNACEYRCDAIVIFPSGSPEVVPFQDPVSFLSLSELYAVFYASRSAGTVKQRETLLTIFKFLWEHCVSKVVNCLVSRGVEKGNRVWWCPASVFSLLPIHAAGMYDRRQPNCNLSDMYISSYTPTISELLRARRPRSSVTRPPVSSNRLLFIGHSGGGGALGELENVETELAAIRKTIDDVTPIMANEANPVTVLDNIRKHRWVHFSCHGAVDPEDPTRSHFVLEDKGRLHVKDLLSAKLDGAELAFLSACHSAAPGLILLDEGIHLSSAMLFAGFRSVVGTMWEMYDEEGPVISELFYKNLLKLGGRHSDAAKALHLAIKARRKSDAKRGIFRPERWVMFVHMGA